MNGIFAAANALILPLWAALILAPSSALTQRLFRGNRVFLPLAAAYAMLVAPHWAELLPLLARPDLGKIQALLGTPFGATVGWLHFLCFDLFVGRWIWQDSATWGAPGWLLRVSLVLTLMFGPAGLLTYVVGKAVLKRLPSEASPLIRLGAFMPPLALICLLGLALDPRMITALPAWIKPLKFTLSVLVYCLTLEAILRYAGEGRWAQRVRSVTALCLALEMVVIGLQAARGTTSHFNQGSLLDGALFALMGLSIAPVWGAAMAATVLVVRKRDLAPGLRTSLVWGLVVAVIGMGFGWPMSALGAHTIGAPDGGPGLPLLGWSTLHGDLRVPHFVGMHALQVLPLAWLAVSGVLAGKRLELWLHGCGLAYCGLTVLLARQAFAGASFLSWDVAVVGWVVACTAVLGWGLCGPTGKAGVAAPNQGPTFVPAVPGRSRLQ